MTEIATLADLISAYQSDPDSPYHKLRFTTKQHYDDTLRLLAKDYGAELLGELKARAFLRWHEAWSAGGKLAVGHLKIGMLRTVIGFGATLLEDENCARLKGLLQGMRFTMAKPREQRLTADQAVAIRAAAHELRRPSIALAQAFQFECMMRQKDVIGEWVPIAEPGLSDVTHKGWKWMRGIRWEEIDPETKVLRHVTSKRQKPLTVNLSNAPMVIEELAMFEDQPASGPIILSEFDCLPWQTAEYRRWWRIVADKAGIPKEVKSMDTRAGAISEATDAGAELEHIRHAATHSDITTTQRYSRGAEAKIETVQRQRVQHRNKTTTQ